MGHHCDKCDGSGYVFEVITLAGGGESVEYIPCPACSSANGNQAGGSPFVGQPNRAGTTQVNADSAHTGEAPQQPQTPHHKKHDVTGEVVLTPHKATSSVVKLPGDQAMEWVMRHKMKQTAPTQAAKLVQAYRQTQVDTFRVECAARAGHQVLDSVGKYAEAIQDVVDSYEAEDPRVAQTIQIAAAGLEDVLVNLPRVAAIATLKRWGIG